MTGYEKLEALEKARAHWMWVDSVDRAFWIAVAFIEKGFEQREFLATMATFKRAPETPKLIELWDNAAIEVERARFLDRRGKQYAAWKRDREGNSRQMAKAVLKASAARKQGGK